MIHTPLHLLLIEDSDHDALFIVRELRRGGGEVIYRRVETPEELQEALHQESWDLVISDYSMPRFTGLAALKICQESGLDIPFIVVSGAISPEVAVSMMKAGAHDYVMKDDLARLVPAVNRELQDAQDRRGRRQAEEEIRRLKDLNEGIVQSMFDGIVIEDLDGYFTFVNPASANMLGYSPEELVGKHWTEIIPPDQHVYVERADERRLQGISDRYTLELIRKDGTRITVLVSGTPRYQNGKQAGSLAVFTDITERIRIEDELRKLKDFNEEIIQSMFEGVGVSDEQGVYTFVNPALANMLGYTPEELIGTHWKYTVMPDQIGIVNDANQRRRTGSSDRYELNLLCKDGKTLKVQVSGSPLFDHGKFVGSLVVLTDITIRAQAEEALRRRTEELAMLHAGSLEITASHDLPSLLNTIVNQARHLLHAPWGSLFICDHERKELRLEVDVLGRDTYQMRKILKYGEGAAGLVALTGKPLIVDDYRTWEHQAPIYESDLPLSAVVSVPLIWRGSAIGVIQVWDDAEQRRFQPADLGLLSLFADQAAIAIENARLLEAERSSRTQAETLRDVAHVLSSSLELDKVLELILEQLKRVLIFNTASVLLFSKDVQPEMVTGIGFRNEMLTVQSSKDLLGNSPILQQMARDLKPVIFDDVRVQPGWIWVPGAEHVRSFMGIPLTLQGELVGVLMVDSIEVGFFNLEDLRVAQALAQHMSVAIQNARLYESERVQVERAEALRQAAQVIGSTLALDQVIQRVMEQLVRVVEIDSGGVMLVENDEIILKVWQGFGNFQHLKRVSEIRFSLIGDQTVGKVVRDGKPLIIPDIHREQNWVITDVGGHIRSWMGVPLWLRDQVIGLFTLDKANPDGFSEEDVTLVQAFAAHAAAAIDNARLFEIVEQRAAELLAIRQASLSLTASLESRAVLASILESAMRFLPGAMNAHIFLYNEEEEALSFGAALWEEGRKGEPIAVPRPHGLTNTVAHTGKMMIVANVRQHPLFGDYHLTPDGEGAIIGLPLRIGNRVVGVMNVAYAHPHIFSEAEQRVLSLLGDQAAIAIENARLYERAAQERKHLALLYDIGRELAASLDTEKVLQRAITLTCKALNGMASEAYLLNAVDGRLILRALYGRGDLSIDLLNQQIDLRLGQGVAGWVAQNKIPANVPDIRLDGRWLFVPGLDEDVLSALASPILVGEQVLGVISVLHRQTGAFTSDHQELLKAICHQVGLALTNAQRYQQVQSLADLLATEQNRLESLLEHIPVGVLLLDEEFRLLVANRLGRQILENFGAVSSGEKLIQLGPCAIPDLCQMAILQQDSGELLPVEIVPDMQPRRVFEVEARPLRSEVRQWVLTIRDVTLEREIQERSRQQERLATVGQLAAGIAHDFNNIMAAILVYTDLMLNDRSLPSTSYERLVIIQQQVQRAASLIRQILDFSRRSVMEQSEIDLLPFMKEMEKLLSRVLPETIHVEFTYDPGSYPVKVDPTRLQQVFMNLALNARDAMPNGGNLRFNLEPIHLLQGEKPPHPELTAGDWVRIEVVDSGQGIPKEILPHVFDPFFTTKPVGQGTGLGLAQVYGVIRQHNGQIDVTSQSGAGTHFRIYLQLLSQAKMEIDEKASTAIDGSGQQVLIVEDDPATREALCAMLAALNFDVLAAANGMEALNVLAERGGQVELVVSDLVMPEMGGIALYEILRDLIPNVKILFITGHPLEMRDQAVLERGEVHWLQKPFSMQEFSSAVKALL